MTSVSWLVLAVFVTLLCLGVRFYITFVRNPGRIGGRLDAIYEGVAHIDGMSERKAQFLDRWDTFSDHMLPGEMEWDSAGRFVGDTFVVWYTDSIHLPGFDPVVHQFRIERPMTGGAD